MEIESKFLTCTKEDEKRIISYLERLRRTRYKGLKIAPTLRKIKGVAEYFVLEYLEKKGYDVSYSHCILWKDKNYSGRNQLYELYDMELEQGEKYIPTYDPITKKQRGYRDYIYSKTDKGKETTEKEREKLWLIESQDQNQKEEKEFRDKDISLYMEKKQFLISYIGKKNYIKLMDFLKKLRNFEGYPDIFAFKKGEFFFVEVKHQDDSLRDAQLDFILKMQKAKICPCKVFYVVRGYLKDCGLK